MCCSIPRAPVALLLLLVIGGCDAPPPPPPSPGQLTVALPRTLTAALVMVAAEQGLFASAGVEVTLVPTEHGSEALNLLLAGQVDLAAVSDVVFVQGAFADADLRLIAAINQADVVRSVVRDGRGISAPSDLRGRRIGYVPNTASEFYTEVFLDLHGLAWADVVPVPVMLADMPGAFPADRADVLVTWNTIALEIAASQPVSVWPAQGEYRLMFVIVAPRALTERAPAALTAFIRALVAAEDLARADPVAAQASVAQLTGLSAGAIASSWADNDFTVSLDRALMMSLEEVTRWLLGHQRLPATAMPNYLDFISFDALVAARPEAATIIR